MRGLAAATPTRPAPGPPPRTTCPRKLALVIGADLTAIAETKLFNTFLALAMAKEPDAKKVFETIKTSCQIDPLSAVHGVVLRRRRSQAGRGLPRSARASISQARELRRAGRQVPGRQGSKLTVKKTGAITEISTDKEKLYVSWIGTDVLVVGSDVHDKAALEKWVGQKGGLAKSPVAKLHGGTNTKGRGLGVRSLTKEPSRA